MAVIIAAAAIGYLLGSVPFGLVLTRLAGLGDVRQIGSGSIGATNVLRTGNKLVAALTLLLDGGKGALAVLLARLMGPDMAVVAGAAAVIGHMFPVWLRFRGGKGVACALGAFLALAPLATAVAGGVCALVVVLTRIGSLGSLLGTAALIPALLAFHQPRPYVILSGAMLALILWRHRENLRRLAQGRENKL